MTFNNRFMIYGALGEQRPFFIDSELGKERARKKATKHAKIFPGRFDRYLLFVADRQVEEIKLNKNLGK